MKSNKLGRFYTQQKYTQWKNIALSTRFEMYRLREIGNSGGNNSFGH